MPSVLMDTSVALPASLSPGGITRKFWLLLAVGALAYRADHLRLELDAALSLLAELRIGELLLG